MQDEKLLEGMQLYEGQGQRGGVNWVKVSEHMGGARTADQCSTRWNQTLKHRGGSSKSGEWSAEEVSGGK